MCHVGKSGTCKWTFQPITKLYEDYPYSVNVTTEKFLIDKRTFRPITKWYEDYSYSVNVTVQTKFNTFPCYPGNVDTILNRDDNVDTSPH